MSRRVSCPDRLERSRATASSQTRPSAGFILFIRKAQELGFSLDEIRELLILNDHSGNACSHIKSLVEEKLATVRARLHALNATEAELKRISAECARSLLRHIGNGAELCRLLAKLGRKE